MSEKLYRRYFVIIAGILALLILLGTSLWQSTVHPREDVQNLSEDKTISTEILRGARGRILGSQGEPLAFEEPSYNVQFRREDGSRKQEEWRPYYTYVFAEVIKVVEKYGQSTVDTFAIVYDPDVDDFVFDWGNLGIENDPDGLELARAIANREKNWRSNMLIRVVDLLDEQGNAVLDEEGNAIKVDPTPREIYNELRSRFYIPEEYTYEHARKILSIWQDVQLSGSTTTPVTIASNVPMEAVAELESRYGELDGVFATATTRRVYPKGDLVSHIVGYTGRIDDKNDNFSRKRSDSAFLNLVHNGLLYPEAQGELTKEEIGYSVNDLIGKMGLERTQEKYLTGSTSEHHGKMVYETSSNRIITRIIEAQQPSNGNDIYLTLDLALQERATSALLENIAITKQAQEEQILKEADEYRKIKEDLSTIKTASFGAVVVLDAKTGKILALVSAPSYDNNLFVGGIDAQSWKNIDDNELLNNWATTVPRMPGSIFKMAVGLAGLEEGAITLDTIIDDEGPYDAPTRDGEPQIKMNQPRCWVNPYYTRHSNQTIVEGLRDSCNYFFFETANRLEWQKETDDDYILGRWAGDYLGLAQATGVEIPESVGQIGGQRVLYNNHYLPKDQRTSIPILVYYQLFEMLSRYCVEYSGPDHGISEESIRDCALELMGLVGSDLDHQTTELGPAIREIIAKHTGIPTGVSEPRRWHQRVSDSISQLRWNINQVVRSGIGQGVVTVTPLAAARYVAALVNGGTLYETHIIDRIVDPSGAVLQETQPVVSHELNAKPEHLDAIKRGMGSVVSMEDGGTAAAAFEGFAYNGQFGGKTGTAQISAEGRNIDIENTSWMVAFAPYDDPEIVVAVCIPYGWKGSMAAPTVKAVIEYWMTRQDEGNMNAPATPNMMLP